MKCLSKYVTVLFVLSAVMLFACKGNNDDDDQYNSHDDAIGDVYVKKETDTAGNHYALEFYAYAKGIKTCKAIAPNGTEYALSSYWRNESQRYLPKPSDYKSSMPDTGQYTFYFEFADGQERALADRLYNLEVDAISAATITHGSGYHGTSVSWSSVDSVDEYVIKLTDKLVYENQALFYQGGFTLLDNGHYFDSTSVANPGWNYVAFPKYGDSCYVLVEAWKNESITSSHPQKNRQMLSDQIELIIW